MRILDTNQLLDVASELIPENELRGYITTLEQTVRVLAARVAYAAGPSTVYVRADYERGFGGLCACFRGEPKCHPLIIGADQGGDCTD